MLGWKLHVYIDAEEPELDDKLEAVRGVPMRDATVHFKAGRGWRMMIFLKTGFSRSV